MATLVGVVQGTGKGAGQLGKAENRHPLQCAVTQESLESI
jgi:hypothetical protein